VRGQACRRLVGEGPTGNTAEGGAAPTVNSTEQVSPSVHWTRGKTKQPILPVASGHTRHRHSVAFPHIRTSPLATLTKADGKAICLLDGRSREEELTHLSLLRNPLPSGGAIFSAAIRRVLTRQGPKAGRKIRRYQPRRRAPRGGAPKPDRGR